MLTNDTPYEDKSEDDKSVRRAETPMRPVRFVPTPPVTNVISTLFFSTVTNRSVRARLVCHET
jgi:hypothetical protein